MSSSVHVTAVVVCQDGARWLPPALTALARSARRPEHIVAVDVGSTDTTPQMLALALSHGIVDEVVEAPRDSGFGSSVRVGLTRDDRTDPDTSSWIWLLHDDCAVAPDALDGLLALTAEFPSIGIVGPKVCGWHDRTLLLESGVTMARSGSRVTGLEHGERDQGQRDAPRDVLAVGSAGMLVRRDLWDTLGGMDPALPMYRDDVDLCWRARRAGSRVVVTGAAVVHHREATTRGRRPVLAGAGGHDPRRVDRTSALHVLLAHAGPLRLPVVACSVVIGSLLRALLYLLGKAPAEAADHVWALLDVFGHPGRLLRSRRLVRRAAALPDAVPEREVRSFLAPRTATAREYVGRAGDLILGTDDGVIDAGDGDGSDAWATSDAPSRLSRLVRRPGVVLGLVFFVTTLVAVRGLIGSGRLRGGALVAAPDGGGDLFGMYTAAWHDVGLGTANAGPPWLVVLAGLAALLRGQAPLAIDVLVLGAVPLAGMSAYLSMRGLVASTRIRLWGATTYALLPALTGAVSGGRLGTCAVAILLPVLLRTGRHLASPRAPLSWRRTWTTGLLLAACAVFVPLIWVFSLVPLVGAIVIGPGGPRRLKAAVVLLVPIALAGPWSARLLAEPALLLLEPGLSGPATTPDPRPLLLAPGGPGYGSAWWWVPVVLAAVLVLLWPEQDKHRRAVVVAWLVAASAVAVAAMQIRAGSDLVAGIATVAAWPGPAALVAGAMLILVIVIGGDGLRGRLARGSFGIRQLMVAVLAVGLVVPTALSGVHWVRGVSGPLTRADPVVVPAFVAADMVSTRHPRVLLLDRVGSTVEFEILAAPAPTLGDRDVAIPVPPSIRDAVAALVAGVGASEVDLLSAESIGYVQVVGRDPALSRTLDSQGGLRRVSVEGGVSLWRLGNTTTRTPLQVTTPARDAWIAVQGAVLVLIVLLALPGRRRVDRDDDDDSTDLPAAPDFVGDRVDPGVVTG